MSNFSTPPLPADPPNQSIGPKVAAGRVVSTLDLGTFDVVFEVVRTRAGFDALEADWQALFDRTARSEHMFLHFNWLWHWANHYLPASTELGIVIGRRIGHLVFVWPLMVERVAGLRQLAFMGAPVSQYGDALVDPALDLEALLEGAWQSACSTLKPDLFRLTKVRADATIAPLLAAKAFRVTSQEEAPAATLSAAPSYADFEQRFSSKLRKNRRRELRRLEERGLVEIKWHHGTADAAGAARLAMTLKRAWLNSRGFISKAFADTRIDAFFADAAGSTGRPCGVVISVLSSTGETANVAISVTCKGRRALHVLAYALKFEKFGVGKQHLDAALQQAHEDGIKVYDFLAPNDAYKMDWADTVVVVADHALALSPLGKLYTDVYLARLREGLKALVKRLPRGVTRLLAGAHRSTH